MEDTLGEIILIDQDSRVKDLITDTLMVGVVTLSLELLYILNVKFVSEEDTLLLIVSIELFRVLHHIFLLNVKSVGRGGIVHWNAITGAIIPINPLDLLLHLHLHFLVQLQCLLSHRVLFNNLRILLLIIHTRCIHLQCKV